MLGIQRVAAEVSLEFIRVQLKADGGNFVIARTKWSKLVFGETS